MMQTLTDEQRERYRAMGRKGGKSRAKAFTSKYQRATRAHVSRESCIANARKGAAMKRAQARAQSRKEGGETNASDGPNE
jgi:hypothetical protein